jgi:hypothetical protein
MPAAEIGGDHATLPGPVPAPFDWVQHRALGGPDGLFFPGETRQTAIGALRRGLHPAAAPTPTGQSGCGRASRTGCPAPRTAAGSGSPDAGTTASWSCTARASGSPCSARGSGACALAPCESRGNRIRGWAGRITSGPRRTATPGAARTVNVHMPELDVWFD